MESIGRVADQDWSIIIQVGHPSEPGPTSDDGKWPAADADGSRLSNRRRLPRACAAGQVPLLL